MSSAPAPPSSPEAATQAVEAVAETVAPVAIRPALNDPEVGWFGKLIQRIERKVSRLSTKNNFWHRSIAWIFLPLAYRSGIKFRGQALSKDGEFECVVPFSRFNKNWYNAMAGAALLANSEVAGGMYIFKRCGSDYTVVCKHLDYKFRRPCVGPAIYRVIPEEDIEPLVATGDEFNITVKMTILQAVVKKDEKERKVGESVATFHVTPKSMFRARKAKQAEKEAMKAARRNA